MPALDLRTSDLPKAPPQMKFGNMKIKIISKILSEDLEQTINEFYDRSKPMVIIGQEVNKDTRDGFWNAVITYREEFKNGST